MNHSQKVGFSFGSTSGVITTLGLMVGLNSGTHSKMVVLGGILAIAIGDAFSDALGIHVSEESEGKHTKKELWESTFATFLSKLFIALTFVVPILMFRLNTAIVVGIIWGLILIALLTNYIHKGSRKKKTRSAIIEHIVITVIVIILTHLVGKGISLFFGNV